MSSPYRDGWVGAETFAEEVEGPLARIDVSGADGAPAIDGLPGTDGLGYGASGMSGHDAGRAQVGEGAGRILLVLARRDEGTLHLGGFSVPAGGGQQRIDQTVALAQVTLRPHRTIELDARGGDGGGGGIGGRGGDGGRGRDGSDATRYSDGGDGGDGGSGGDGGNGSRGGDGGPGGVIEIAVAERDTALLMLIEHDSDGGDGGAPGANGFGGDAGRGGSGGSSYSWTETETSRNSDGSQSTRSVSHRNSGGSDGRRGRDGRPGTAVLEPGQKGALGRFSIQVHGEGGKEERYPSRYRLCLVGFTHGGRVDDGIYEPGEEIVVSAVEVENLGGMPMPTGDEVAVELMLGDWVMPVAGKLVCPLGLSPGARARLDGELTFRVRDHDPSGPGAPFYREEVICARAYAPVLRREFPAFQTGPAYERGRIEISFPAELSPAKSLHALAVGEATRVRVTVTNVSKRALGKRSPGGRRLHVWFGAAPGSELGDEAVELWAPTEERASRLLRSDSESDSGSDSDSGSASDSDSGSASASGSGSASASGSGSDAASASGSGSGSGSASLDSVSWEPVSSIRRPSDGVTREIELLEPGASIEVEVVVAFKNDATDYCSFSGLCALQLGSDERPTAPRRVQLSGFHLRVARPFSVDEADVLLVVNHRTERAVIEAWEALAARLSARIAVWDLSREGHLDLERPLDDGRSLAQRFSGKAVVVLNNEIDGPDGPSRAHAWLRSEQVTRAAASGLDLAFVGKGPNLRHLLLAGARRDELAPMVRSNAQVVAALRSGVHAATAVCYRSYRLRFWAKPQASWLERRAHSLSRALERSFPSQRHAVVFRFAPELVATSWWWGSRWKVGTLETLQVLAPIGNAVVQLTVEDPHLAEPSYVRTAASTATVLAMFDFDEQLERLRRSMLPEAGAETRVLEAIVDALVVDVIEELMAALQSGARHPGELAAALPRLGSLPRGVCAAVMGTAPAEAVIRLASRVRFVAQSQITWWQKLPPWRWLGTVPRAAQLVEEHLDALIVSAFSAAERQAARVAVDRAMVLMEETHRRARKAGATAKRSWWSLEVAMTPLLLPEVHGDAELLTRPEERVLSGEEHDAIFADEEATAVRREQLMAAAATAREQLLVRRVS